MTKKIKLIVADMDGTLLNNKKEIPSNMKEVLDVCNQNDVMFAIGTGRQMANIKNYFKDLQKDLLIIAENGSYADKNGETLFYSAIDQKYLPEIIDRSRNIEQCWPVLCSDTMAYIESDYAPLVEECKKYYHHLEIVDDLKQVNAPICKVALCDLKGAEFNCAPQFADLQEQLQITVSAAIWLDISNLNINKGNTLAMLQEQMDISIEETMAFGDYLNDVSLLPRAKYSYAMENAHPELKKLANYIAPTNEEAGVAKVILEYFK